MNYCPSCGAYIPDGQTKCVACGFDTAKKPEQEKKEQSEYSYSYGGGAAAQETPRQAEKSNTYNYDYNSTQTADDGRAHGYYDPSGRVNNQSRSAPFADLDDNVMRNKGMAALCYFGPLFIITLLTRRQSHFAMYHANQGLMLFLMEIVIAIGAAVIPWLGWVVNFVGGILIFVAFVSGLINAFNGVEKPIPFVGNVTLIK